MDSDVSSDGKQVFLIVLCLISWVVAAIAIVITVAAGIDGRFGVVGIFGPVALATGFLGYYLIRNAV